MIEIIYDSQLDPTITTDGKRHLILRSEDRDLLIVVCEMVKDAAGGRWYRTGAFRDINPIKMPSDGPYWRFGFYIKET